MKSSATHPDNPDSRVIHVRFGSDQAAEPEQGWYGAPTSLCKIDEKVSVPWPLGRIVEGLVEWHVRRRIRKGAISRA